MLRQTKNNDKFTNIVDNNFASVESKTKVYRAVVVQAISGNFKLTLFALIQFLMGAGSDFLYMGFISTEKFKDFSKLMSKLSMHMLVLQDNTEATIELTREEVELMRALLEGRMKHCEHERDSRSDKFNADTYISQKLLLLDMREWLMCQSMEVQSEIVQDEEVSMN